MKALLIVILFAALAFAIRVSRPLKVMPIFQEELPGHRNPPLHQIGDAWPLKTGSRLWLRTNQQPFATVTRCNEELAEVTLADGTRTTLARRQARNNWTE